MKKVVKIVRPWGVYSPGDVAGFEEDLAERLIEGKVAVPHEEKPEEKPKAAK